MLSQVLNHLHIDDIEVDLTRLPKTDKYVSIGGIEVPLYGELLVGETYLQTKVSEAAMPYIKSISNLYKGLGVNNVTLENLISQLQVGKVLVNKYEDYTPDYDNLGYKEIKDLADKAGVKDYFTSPTLSIEGYPSESLIDIMRTYFDEWVNNGIPGNSALDMLNHVLQKLPVKRIVDQEVKEVDGDKLLSEVKLTWSDLHAFRLLDSRYFEALLLIFFRTGIKDYNPFDYMSVSSSEEALKTLMKETSKPEEVEEIKPNLNVQVDKKEGGDESCSLKPQKESLASTGTSKPAKQKEEKEIANKK